MIDISRPDDVRRLNRANVLSALRQGGAVSRTGIAGRTRLSAATVSTITADLLESGVLLRLEEMPDGDGQMATPRGRPRVSLAFNPDFACIGVIVLQLNLIMVSIVDYQGATIFKAQEALETTSISAEKLLDQMVAMLRDALKSADSSAGALRHIAVGVQGTTDVEGKTMLWSPVTGNQNLPIQAALEPEFGVPVSVHNDCNMIAIALRWREPERYKTDFAAILLSQGIGMGLFHQGELVVGKRSSATEFGHMTYIPGGALCRCGRRGCIEAYASEYAIYRRANKLDVGSLPGDNIALAELDTILDHAHQKNPDALQAYEQAGQAIGAGLASLFALIDPFPVAFVGSGSRAENYLRSPINNAIGQSKMSLDTEPMEMQFYPDKNPLIRDGCAVTALMEVDERIRSNRFIMSEKARKIA